MPAIQRPSQSNDDNTPRVPDLSKLPSSGGAKKSIYLGGSAPKRPVSAPNLKNQAAPAAPNLAQNTPTASPNVATNAAPPVVPNLAPGQNEPTQRQNHREQNPRKVITVQPQHQSQSPNQGQNNQGNRRVAPGNDAPIPTVEKPVSYIKSPSVNPANLPADVEEEYPGRITLHTSKKPVAASAGEWTNNLDEDPYSGPMAEAYRPGEKESVNQRTGITKRRRNSIRLTERDIYIIRILGKYKFGYRRQVEEYFDRQDLSRRMTQLRRAGYLRNEKITQNEAVWTPTQAGIDIAGLEVPVLTHGRISPTTVSHTVGLLNIGMWFEKGEENMLNEHNFPHNWKMMSNLRNDGFHLEQGETVVTERMINQSYQRELALVSGNRSILRQRRDEALRWIPNSPREENMFGPESLEGNEWMFVGMEPHKAHVPDMVLVRPRNSDGTSRHVAIELELSSKNSREVQRILEGFRDNPMIGKVAYFTHRRQVMNLVTTVNRNFVRMNEDQFLVKKYNPPHDGTLTWG